MRSEDTDALTEGMRSEDTDALTEGMRSEDTDALCAIGNASDDIGRDAALGNEELERIALCEPVIRPEEEYSASCPW
jgi:hypothetical protein